MQQFVTLDKKHLDDFISRLAQSEKVVAPVAKGFNNFSFQEVKTAKDISVKYIPTILPPKKYFMPTQENIVEYNKSDNSASAVLEYDKLVIFGVHTCDLAGIQCLNMALADKPKDINYIVRKNKIAIIGLECNDYCDKFASCAVVGNYLPNGGYDLFFTEFDKYFLVHMNTLIGEEIVAKSGLFKKAKEEDLAALDKLRAQKSSIFKNEVNLKQQELKKLFDKAGHSKVWEDLDKRCVACGNCTNVCPTCYCFDIIDEINLDVTTGVRYRKWDSCQSQPFAQVAGGENFRKKRGARQLHRYMRKFYYPVDKYRRYFCTGCGRCSRTCMAKINLKETINSLVEELK